MPEAVTVAGPVTAGEFTTLVRVHADRVHDFVRRQGCPPDASADAVETSALALLTERGDPARLVGRWFALAREAALERVRRAGPTAAPWLPVGRGLLAEDGQQDLLAAAMDRREPRGRAALLLRDAYDLPVETVAAALGLDDRAAADLVGQARLDLLPDVFDDEVPARPAHPADGPALARLAEGRPGPDDGPTARHVRACPACHDLVTAQEDVRRLLSGLAVVALPDELRDPVLGRVGRAARAQLPASALAVEVDEPRRVLSVGPVVVCVVLAVLAGVGLGAWLSRPTPVRAAPTGLLVPVTAPAVTPMPVPPVPSAQPLPATTVFTYPPTVPPPTTSPPAPSTSPPAPPPTTAPVAGTVSPTPRTGAAGVPVLVSGTGWVPGRTLQIALLDDRGTPVAGPVSTSVGLDGRFRASLPAGTATTPPGTYTITVGDGSVSARATYRVLS